MNKFQWLVRILLALVSFLLVLLVLEGFLRLTDPWGMHYFNDLQQIFSRSVPDPTRTYVMQDGRYEFRGWEALIGSDHTRYVPDTNKQAACQIVFLGDSVTFGHGVNDSETWINLVARELPGVHIVNAGVNGYNSGDVLAASQAFPSADAFVYFIAGNDDDEAINFAGLGGEKIGGSWLSRYIAYGRFRMGGPVPAATLLGRDRSRFIGEVEALAANPRVTLMGFEQDVLIQEIMELFPNIIQIDVYTTYNSYADAHPDPAGNQQMARDVLPYIQDMWQTQCQDQDE